jgi:hypothetical protein
MVYLFNSYLLLLKFLKGVYFQILIIFQNIHPVDSNRGSVAKIHVNSLQGNKEQVPWQCKESLIMPVYERPQFGRLERRDNMRSSSLLVSNMVGYYWSGY